MQLFLILLLISLTAKDSCSTFKSNTFIKIVDYNSWHLFTHIDILTQNTTLSAALNCKYCKANLIVRTRKGQSDLHSCYIDHNLLPLFLWCSLSLANQGRVFQKRYEHLFAAQLWIKLVQRFYPLLLPNWNSNLIFLSLPFWTILLNAVLVEQNKSRNLRFMLECVCSFCRFVSLLQKFEPVISCLYKFAGLKILKIGHLCGCCEFFRFPSILWL